MKREIAAFGLAQIELLNQERLTRHPDFVILEADFQTNLHGDTYVCSK